jgi:hypothetical protein
LIPETLDGFIAADKHISTTHIVNGSTRLQPVVMGIGQAAGAAAALSVLQGLEPRAVSVRHVQQILLDHNAWILPYADVTPADAEFQAIQRVAAAGWMRGTGEPSAWANRTWFHPDRAVTDADIDLAVDQLRLSGRTVRAQDLRDEMPMSRRMFATMLDTLYEPFE